MKKRFFSLLMALVMVMSLVASLSIQAFAAGEDDPRVILDDGNGNTQTVMFQGNYTLPECSFTAPEGYRFKCWLVDGDRQMQPGDTIYVDGKKTVTAVWEALPVVTFDNGGGTGTMDPVWAEGEYTLPKCGFTAPAGKQFQCWLVADQQKQPGERITVSADVTVSASWAELPTEAPTEAPTQTPTEHPQEPNGDNAPSDISWWTIALIAVVAAGAGVVVALLILKKKEA